MGTVVKAGEEEDPIGVLTVLNTQRYRALESLKQIRNFLEKNCADESKKAAILNVSCLSTPCRADPRPELA